MVNYANGKIYKIIVTAGHSKCYVGSTTKQYLSQRMAQHVSVYNRWKKGINMSNFGSFELFEQFGVDNCSIILIENAAVSSKDELRLREQAQIDKHDCVNKQRAFSSEEYRKQKDKIRKHEYQKQNKESITAKRSSKVPCLCGKHFAKWYLSSHRKRCKDYAFDKYMADTIKTYQQVKPLDIIMFKLD